MQVFRHSAAHLLAAAVLELYPDVKLGVGPPIENGFFYEFVREQPFTPEDLEKIEAKMREIAARDVPNERKMIPKPEALELYRKANQGFKCELVEEKALEPMVSFYTTGKFIDFCRGPHIPSTGRIKAFKLMNVAGAYWKGDEKNPQMQRIYGACFVEQKELDEYLHKLEEAKRRDHRKLGAELDLFSIQDEAGPGLIFLHPKGGLIAASWKIGCVTSSPAAATNSFTPRTSCCATSGKPAATPATTAPTCSAPSKSKRPITNSNL